jgi:hypothetical protein
LVVAAAFAQEPRPLAVPAGPIQAGQAEAKADRDLPPPIQAKRTIDLAKLQQEANDLSKLAQSIPPDVAAVQNGMFPKDVVQKLKQIEKLSKQLRGELNP